MAIDSRYLTTPIGALVGLAIARKLIPEDNRTVLNQATGAALGGGLGYLGGDYINDYVNNPRTPEGLLREFKNRHIALGDSVIDPEDKDLEVFAPFLPKKYKNLSGIKDSEAKKLQKDILKMHYYRAARNWAKENKFSPDTINAYADRENEYSSNIKNRAGILGSIFSSLGR